MYVSETVARFEAYTWITAASQTPTPTPTPIPTPASLVIPGRIEAESYTSYFDTTAGNFGDYTLRGDDVDIKNTADGPTMGYTANGEWLAYTVTIQATGSYTTSLRVANGMTTNGSVHLELNGSNISGAITVAPTGSWDTQTTITGPNLNLTQGTHTLKVVFDVTPVDLNWMEFTQAATPTPAPTACHLYTPGATVPSGYGVPWDTLSGQNELLIKATCDTASAKIDLGRGNALQYIYNTGYLFKTGGTDWSPFTYTSPETLIVNAWYPKIATATLSLTSTELAQPSYVLGYICSWVGTQWKCGCQDSACTQSHWQIQSFKR